MAYTLLVLIIGTNLPSPLYGVYQHRFGFGPLVVTLIFAAYAAALVPALLLAGPLADAIGYRRVLVPAVLLAAGGTVLFAFADTTGWLFAARAVQGLAVGAGSGALTAALVTTEPSGDQHRASLLASTMTTAGGGLGPVLAGLLAQYLPAPTTLCYLVEIALLAPALVAVAALPVATRRERAALAGPRVPHVPAAARGPFAAAAVVSFLAWAVTALFLTLVPSSLSTLTGSHNLALAGLAAGLILLSAAAVQAFAQQWPASRTQPVGLVLLVTGLAALVLTNLAASPALLLISAVIAGAGQGLAFMGALRQANAAGQGHAGVISAFYVATYLGVGVPVVGVGLLAAPLGLGTAVDIFAAVISSCCLATGLWLRRSDTQAH